MRGKYLVKGRYHRYTKPKPFRGFPKRIPAHTKLNYAIRFGSSLARLKSRARYAMAARDASRYARVKGRLPGGFFKKYFNKFL